MIPSTQRIFPSVMAQNQQELDALFKKLSGVAKILHLDVADGKAVPNTSLWFPFKLSKKFSYNAHLMVKDPEKWIEKYGKKMDLCIFQWEVIAKKYEGCLSCCAIPMMKHFTKRVAIALRHETSVKEIKPYLQDIDVVLILTVHPGFYGAKFLSAPLQKIKMLKKMKPSLKIIVDGGMTPENIGNAARAGADYFVSGSFVSKSDEPKKAYKKLQEVTSLLPGVSLRNL